MSLEKSGGFRSRTPKAQQEPAKQKPQARKSPSKKAPARGQGQSQGQRQGQSSGKGGGNRKPPAQAREVRALGVDKPREIAFEVLDRVRTGEAYANLVLPRLLSKHNLSGRDAAFATEITYGTLRNVGLLDEVIKAASGRELSDIDPEVLDVLRLGAYQVMFTRVEDHAAVDTSVKMVGGLKKLQATGFANAILRNITRKEP